MAINSLNFLNEAILANGTTFNGTDVIDLSGITYDATNGVYYLISDQSDNPRFYTFDIEPQDFASGTLGVGNITAVTSLRDSNGNLLGAGVADSEGIALTSNGTVFIASEGILDPSAAANHIDPFIDEFNVSSGNQVDSLTIPSKFLPEGQIEDDRIIIVPGLVETDVPDVTPSGGGVRLNTGFEGLSLTPDEEFLFAAVEAPLAQDSSTTEISLGNSLNRILKYDLDSGDSVEFLYKPETFRAVSEVLAIDEENLLVLERGSDNPLAENPTISVELYQVSLADATDISGNSALNGNDGGITAASKTLLQDFDDLPISEVGSFEALTFGPTLANGNSTLLVVNDNNGTENTQFLTFEFTTEVDLGTVAGNVINNFGGNDLSFGFSGGDTINGGADDDVIRGGNGADNLNGEAGDDILVGGNGNDNLTGGDGGDIFVLRSGQGIDSVTDFEDGVDKIAVLSGLEFADLNLNSTAGGVEIAVGATGEVLATVDGVTPNNLDANDFITASGGSVGDNDFFFGDGNSNNLSGGNGNDYIYGRAGNDTLNGDGGIDHLYGQNGNDTLIGGEGNDFLQGGAGNDNLTGGDGQDTFVLAAGKGTDTITDFEDGSDIIRLNGGIQLGQLSITDSLGNVDISFNGETLATLQGVSAADLSADDFLTF